MLSYDQILTQLTDVLQAETPERLLDVFERIVANSGGTGFGIGVVPGAGRQTFGYNRGLNGYPEHYEESGYGTHCPVTRRVARATHTFLWNEVLIDEDDRMGRAVMNVAREFGLNDGLLVPMQMRDGRKGAVFVCVPGTELRGPVQQWLTMLCMAFHSRLMQLGVPQVNEAEPLSGREREVLQWMAQGKSAEDVAEILGISAATVMFHYRNVAVRYGTLNRTHTVVEALRRGSLAIG